MEGRWCREGIFLGRRALFRRLWTRETSRGESHPGVDIVIKEPSRWTSRPRSACRRGKKLHSQFWTRHKRDCHVQDPTAAWYNWKFLPVGQIEGMGNGASQEDWACKIGTDSTLRECYFVWHKIGQLLMRFSKETFKITIMQHCFRNDTKQSRNSQAGRNAARS